MRGLAVVVVGAIAAIALAGCPSASEPQNTLDLPGVDTTDLTHREKTDWSAYVSEMYAPCADVAVSVAQCITEKRHCARCMDAAKFLYARVREGQTREQITTLYKARFDPSEVKTIPIDGSPAKGPENARVTIVEFADFECPGCRELAPVLDAAQEKHAKDVRLVYKFFPLVQRHAHAEDAARAAIAAMAHNKFWEMHHILFTNQERLDLVSLEGYARELDIDIAQFSEDMRSTNATDRIARDGKLIESLHVDHTPTVFVNGRYVDDPMGTIDDWINGELGATE
jgi:protein-disulfide isomerase